MQMGIPSGGPGKCQKRPSLWPKNVYPRAIAPTQMRGAHPWLGLFRFGLCYFRRMSRTFLYRRPNTGQNVQGWSTDEVTDEGDTYQSFQYVACTSVHRVNVKTGKVLGEEED